MLCRFLVTVMKSAFYGGGASLYPSGNLLYNITKSRFEKVFQKIHFGHL
jgi:hypothetical protein